MSKLLINMPSEVVLNIDGELDPPKALLFKAMAKWRNNARHRGQESFKRVESTIVVHSANRLATQRGSMAVRCNGLLASFLLGDLRPDYLPALAALPFHVDTTILRVLMGRAHSQGSLTACTAPSVL